MRTITFYSYKGGVGRTLAAANFARYLAKLGHTAVMLDFDLDAPGLDSKMPGFQLQPGQMGLLDYILEYQRTGSDPGSVKQICLPVPVDSRRSKSSLWLIPGGNYLDPEYSRKLTELDWNIIFSEKREGVVFFQQLIARIEEELQADFAIVDSRTGISEIGGLCTQQLANEVVMLSSLSAESIKVSRHISEIIRQSEIARTLGKSVDVKIVVSRVPKPNQLLPFKQWCSEMFGVEETKLFFLFSCAGLESQEFLAIDEPTKEEDLVADYVRLFYGLDIELASQSIRAEIDRTVQDILSPDPDQTAERIVELATFYPHPEVYRTAMRFFRLVDDPGAMRRYAWMLLDLVPQDNDAIRVLAKSYVREYQEGHELEKPDDENAAAALKVLWERNELGPEEAVTYASILDDLDNHDLGLEVALALYEDQRLGPDDRIMVRQIAARCASELGQNALAMEMVAGIPVHLLWGHLALKAIQMHHETDGPEHAFQFGLSVLQHDWTQGTLELTAQLAHQLSRVKDLEDVLRSSDQFSVLRRRRTSQSRQLIEQLQGLGLSDLAREIEAGQLRR